MLTKSQKNNLLLLKKITTIVDLIKSTKGNNYTEYVQPLLIVVFSIDKIIDVTNPKQLTADTGLPRTQCR